LGPGEIATSLNPCLVVLRRWRSTSSLVVLVMRGDYSSPGEHGSRVGFSLRSGPSRASGEGSTRRGRNRPLANARTDDKCRDHGLACPERPDPSVGVLVGVLVGRQSPDMRKPMPPGPRPFLGRPLPLAAPHAVTNSRPRRGWLCSGVACSESRRSAAVASRDCFRVRNRISLDCRSGAVVRHQPTVHLGRGAVVSVGLAGGL
jgi:hypothetical protein